MSKYLLEIGVEELPYGLIDSVCEQIKNNLEKNLSEANVGFSNIKIYSTPRRLVFIIEGLAEIQPDMEKVYKGPSLSVALDVDGNYTQAALGFARKYGAEAKDLFKLEENGHEYVAVKVFIKGKSLGEILPDMLPDCVLKIQGPHFMRWAGLDEKFSRPIRWIVSILDNKELPVEITGIKSSNKSRAHRFCEDKNPVITDVDSYFEIMHNHNVIVDEEERKDVIVKSVTALAESVGATVKIEPELLKEVTNIVEWPHAVLGEFDEKYLQIPEPVIVTVMASHQRYFPVYKGNTLLNCFITVANFVGDDISNIKNGNERVIKARLDDAIFFYNEDLKKPLIERVNDLEGTTFQKGLGSLKDKVARIIKLSDIIAKNLGYTESDEVYKNTMRTALFCKADLTTSLVFEFTELQGVIGAHYAKVSGENPAVAIGIEEHYYPLVADAELAHGLEGQIVGIADKLDTICGVFILNKIPTGSADPLGVRRAAVGIMQTIMKKRLKLDLETLIQQSLSTYNMYIDIEKLQKELAIFLIQRLRGIFAGKYRNDIVDAVLGARKTLKNLPSIEFKLDLLNEMKSDESLGKIIETHTRITKIVQSANVQDELPAMKNKDVMSGSKLNIGRAANDIFKTSTMATIQPELFTIKAEHDLYQAMQNLYNNKTVSFKVFYQSLVNFIPVVEKFFEDVMVMDKDILIRGNRIKLLKQADKEFLRIADFTKIIK